MIFEQLSPMPAPLTRKQARDAIKAMRAEETQASASLQRGDATANGRFVGVSRGGVAWVAYGDDADFRSLCDTFDRTQR